MTSFESYFCLKVLVAQSCPTLCDPMGFSPPGSSVHGVLQARILEWLPFPSPGDLPNPGIEPSSLLSPAWAGEFPGATWEALVLLRNMIQCWTFAYTQRRAWQPTPVFSPGESHGPRSLGAPVHRVAESNMAEAAQHSTICLYTFQCFKDAPCKEPEDRTLPDKVEGQLLPSRISYWNNQLICPHAV